MKVSYLLLYFLISFILSLALPTNEHTFLELLTMYFPNIFDVKTMMNAADMHGGLSKLGDDLKLERIGTQHTAGSDALLTSNTYFAMVEQHFGGFENFDKERFRGDPYGLSSSAFHF